MEVARAGMDSRQRTTFAIRRVVTGHDANGKAVVVEDRSAPHVFEPHPGLQFAELWSTKDMPAAVGNGDDPTARPLTLKPPHHGSVFRVVSHPPEQAGSGEIGASQARELFSSIGATEAASGGDDSPHATMHRTETVDYAIIMQGRICLALDESEVELAQGDVVIQRGTNHAWINRSSEPCLIAFVLLDGRFDQTVADTRSSSTHSRNPKDTVT